MWLEFEYRPKRWMQRVSYYKARRLHRIVMRRYLNKVISVGRIGRWDSVRFVISKEVV